MLMEIPAFVPPTAGLQAYWEDFLTDDDIQRILSMDAWNSKNPATIGLTTGEDGFDRGLRISNIAGVYPNEENRDLWQKFSTVFARVNSEFFQFNLSGFYEHMQLTYYEAAKDIKDSGYYGWHMDLRLNEPGVMRKLSMSLMLSDPAEFEGGDLQIFIDGYGPQTLEQKKGRAWFFPSWVLHRVTPVTKGVRKTVVLWSGGPAFK